MDFRCRVSAVVSLEIDATTYLKRKDECRSKSESSVCFGIWFAKCTYNANCQFEECHWKWCGVPKLRNLCNNIFLALSLCQTVEPQTCIWCVRALTWLRLILDKCSWIDFSHRNRTRTSFVRRSCKPHKTLQNGNVYWRWGYQAGKVWIDAFRNKTKKHYHYVRGRVMYKNRPFLRCVTRFVLSFFQIASY